MIILEVNEPKLILMWRKFCAVIVVLVMFTSSHGSFDRSKTSNDTTVSTFFSNKQIELVLGKKLTIKEKVALFFVRHKFRNEIQEPFTNAEDEKVRANKKAKMSLTFAILSFITPIMLIPAIIFKGEANKNKELLTPESVKKLKAVNFICKFWLVVGILSVILSILAIVWFVALFSNLN